MKNTKEVISFKGTGGLKAAIITADKPEKLKRKEEEDKKKEEIKKKESGMIPWPAGYTGKKPRRVDDGVIIRLDNLCDIEYNGNIVTVGAGYPLIKLAIETIDKGLSGLEFAAGIPGFVGASTAMNAGAYNSDMSTVVKSARVLNDSLEIITLTNEELLYEYRDSFLKKNKNNYVLSTTFELKYGDREIMQNLIAERRRKRLASQPLNMPSAGSVFRNPTNMYAGELIEKSNLKGYTIGGAKVSEKHANFIVNNGNATGKDIVELIKKIQKDVKENYNVELKLEQIIIE